MYSRRFTLARTNNFISAMILKELSLSLNYFGRMKESVFLLVVVSFDCASGSTCSLARLWLNSSSIAMFGWSYSLLVSYSLHDHPILNEDWNHRYHHHLPGSKMSMIWSYVLCLFLIFSYVLFLSLT